MKALEIARRLIAIVEETGENPECIIRQANDEEVDGVSDYYIGGLSLDHRDGLNNPRTIKFFI